MHRTTYPSTPENSASPIQQLRDLIHALRLVVALVARPYAAQTGAL